MVHELSAYQNDVQGLDVAILTMIEGGAVEAPIQVYEGKMRSGFDIHPGRLRNIYRVLKQYDILHWHGFSPQIAVCSLLAGRPIVHTEHGTFKRANQRQSWTDFVKKRLLGVPFLRRFPAQVVFVSDWLRQEVGLETDRGIVVHNGTAMNGRVKRASVRDQDTFQVLFAGRLAPVKRVDRLISAFASLEKSEGVHLHIVGDGPSRTSLEEQAREMLQPGRYTFHGYCTDVDPFYEAADLVVLPTRGESFGLVAIEAMRWGVPILCCPDGGGVVEVLEGVHDKLVVDDLARAIMFWRGHPEEQVRVGQQLQERALSYFTVERMAEDYKQVYEHVLNGQDEAARL